MTTDNPKNDKPEATAPEAEPKATAEEQAPETEDSSAAEIPPPQPIPDGAPTRPDMGPAPQAELGDPSLPPLVENVGSDPFAFMDNFGKQMVQSAFHLGNLDKSVTSGLGHVVVGIEKIGEASEELKQTSKDFSEQMRETAGIQRREGWERVQLSVSSDAPIALTVMLSGAPEVLPHAINLLTPYLSAVLGKLGRQSESAQEVDRG